MIEIFKLIGCLPPPCIPLFLDEDQTFKLLQNGSSLARYGDGELALMRGKSIPFQQATPFLSKRLKQVLKEKDKDFLIGLPRFLYYEDKNNKTTKVVKRKTQKEINKTIISIFAKRSAVYFF